METAIKFSRVSKELMQKHLEAEFKGCPDFVVNQYANLPTSDAVVLRKTIKRFSSKHLVVKNTICQRVLEKMGVDGVVPMITGTVGVTFIKGDVVEVSKAIMGFSKEHEAFIIKGAYIEGKHFDPSAFKELASLPSKQVMRAMLVSTLMSPISGLVNVLAGLPRNLVYALNAIKEKREKETK